jgi:hypothetical protein
MQVDDFIQRLSEQMGGHHRTFPPLDNKELETWISKFPQSTLPEDYVSLLKRTNGIQFWVGEGSPNGYFQILHLRDIDTARQIMWGGLLNDIEEDEVPYPHWLALTDHQDGAVFIVLDTDSGRYYLMDSCGADLTCPAGKNVNELLDYVWKHWIEPMKGYKKNN